MLHEFPSARADNRCMLDNEFDLAQLARAIILRSYPPRLLLFVAPPPRVSGFAGVRLRPLPFEKLSVMLDVLASHEAFHGSSPWAYVNFPTLPENLR